MRQNMSQKHGRRVETCRNWTKPASTFSFCDCRALYPERAQACSWRCSSASSSGRRLQLSKEKSPRLKTLRTLLKTGTRFCVRSAAVGDDDDRTMMTTMKSAIRPFSTQLSSKKALVLGLEVCSRSLAPSATTAIERWRRRCRPKALSYRKLLFCC